MIENKDNTKLTYIEVLERVQEYFRANHSSLLLADDKNEGKKETKEEETERHSKIKHNIINFLKESKCLCDGYTSINKLSLALFNSMCMYDFLTPYLTDDKFILDNKIEEININAWNAIWITDKNGTYLHERTFPSKKRAVDFLNMIGTSLDKTANEGTPTFLGEIRKNIRIACTVYPVADSEAGITASIRIVSLVNYTTEDLLNFGTTNQEMIDLLSTLLSNEVNICFAGSTGSGKTGSLNTLLSLMLEKTRKRLITIEIESREFSLQKFDENGRPIYNIVNWTTRESPDERYNISCDDLSNLSMRYDGQVIAIGEMRNKEALLACEIATSGHTVITTTHSNNALSAYDRIVDLCKKADPYTDRQTLYTKAIKAFPIIAFQEQMLDGTRRITEIIEGIEFVNNAVIYKTLWSYDVISATKKLVTGEFKKKSSISDKLQVHLKKFLPEYEIKSL